MSVSDECRTPDELFNKLNEEFNFDIDLCATKENKKCKFWCGDYLNYLKLPNSLTQYNCAFINPPYSNPKPFIEKAWEDSKHCKIVCLVKCDPSTKWWATFWDYNITQYICDMCEKQKSETITVCENCGFDDPYKTTRIYNGPKPGCGVRFFPKRIKFDPPIELIESGKVKKKGKKWVWRCTLCVGTGFIIVDNDMTDKKCKNCKHNKEITGPTFPSALIIMDRRNEY